MRHPAFMATYSGTAAKEAEQKITRPERITTILRTCGSPFNCCSFWLHPGIRLRGDFVNFLTLKFNTQEKHNNEK